MPTFMIDKGCEDFAARWIPILHVYDEVGVRFAHEVHPSEIAYDDWTPAWIGWSGRRRRWSFVRRPAFDPPSAAFDAAFSSS